MPVTLQRVIEHVEAMEDPPDRAKVAGMVRETIKALGLEVNPRSGEVYNPAPSSSSVPEDNWRKSVRLSQRRR